MAALAVGAALLAACGSSQRGATRYARCPARHGPNAYRPVLSRSSGRSGAIVAVSGAVPDGTDGVVAWWGVTPDTWPTVLTHPTRGTTRLDAEDVVGLCSYRLTVTVPRAGAGLHSIVALFSSRGSVDSSPGATYRVAVASSPRPRPLLLTALAGIGAVYYRCDARGRWALGLRVTPLAAGPPEATLRAGPAKIRQTVFAGPPVWFPFSGSRTQRLSVVSGGEAETIHGRVTVRFDEPHSLSNCFVYAPPRVSVSLYGKDHIA